MPAPGIKQRGATMKKFIAISAFAIVLGLGTSNTAHAQLVYGYTIPADGGVESVGTRWSTFGPQSYNNFYSPITGYMSETSGTVNTLWSRGSYTSIYSPFTGYMTESRGTVQTPFGLASYLNYNSPFTGPVSSMRLNNAASANNSNLANFNQVVPFNAGRWFLTNGNTTTSNVRHK
jgi:hypothetical protein